MVRIGLFCAVTLALTGCAGLRVSSLSETDQRTKQTSETKLPGIPIRVKIPVWVQETKILETGWQIQFLVKKNGSKDSGFRIPESGPIVLSCATAQKVNDELNNILQSVDRSANEDAIRDQLRSKLLDIYKLDATASPECRRVVGNMLKQESRLSDRAYYVTNVIPLFGSGSGTFKLASDGTLTEVTTQATDDTAKTLLGLLPIKETLMLRWGVDKQTESNNFAEVKPLLFTIEANLTAQKRLYTLHRDVTSESADGTTTPRPKLERPLQFDAYEDGSAELVSIESGDSPPPEKPDTKSFKISGSITPPESQAQSQ